MVATTATPTANDDEICDSGSVALTATGSGTLNWYTNIDDTVPVFSGVTYNTPTINSTTTYYVEDQINICVKCHQKITEQLTGLNI